MTLLTSEKFTELCVNAVNELNDTANELNKVIQLLFKQVW